MPRRKGLTNVYVIYSRFLKRILTNSRGEMFLYQNFTDAKKGAAAILKNVLKSDERMELVIVECKLNEYAHVDYRRSDRSIKRDKMTKST